MRAVILKGSRSATAPSSPPVATIAKDVTPGNVVIGKRTQVVKDNEEWTP